jgi:hypothetical protein
MAGKFGGEFNLADWRLDQHTAKLNSAKFLYTCALRTYVGIESCPDPKRVGTSPSRSCLARVKFEPHWASYGVVAIFSTSAAVEGPLSHWERSTSSKRVGQRCWGARQVQRVHSRRKGPSSRSSSSSSFNARFIHTILVLRHVEALELHAGSVPTWTRSQTYMRRKVYTTAKLKSAKFFSQGHIEQSAKYNSRQYFRPYGRWDLV